MNGDQKLVATIGLALILVVIFGAYRKTFSDILFNAPPTNTDLNPLTYSPITHLLGSDTVTPQVTNTTAPTVTVPTVNVGTVGQI